MNTEKMRNPMSEYLLKIQLIVTNSEFKNRELADSYETVESKLRGEIYVKAMNKTDSYESYDYDQRTVYDAAIKCGYDDPTAMKFAKDPMIAPQNVRTLLLSLARKQTIENYVETNKYYASMTGKPFKGGNGQPADPVIMIPDEFYNMYWTSNNIYKGQPIHELSGKYQELFINSEYYQKTLKENPDVEYLKYIGSNAIPIEVSRDAKDGAILRINTGKLSTYHPVFGNVTVDADIIHCYVNSYNATRDYVYGTLRGNFSSIYSNYNDFIRFLTIYLSIGNCLNELMRNSASMIYMNNVSANNFFMLYGLPSVIMEGTSMIEFLKKFRMILADKGTNVVYRVKDLIGYQYTDIYTLVMVKQQQFVNGIPVYTTDENGNKVPKQEIIFRRLGTTDENTSYFKFRDSNETYTLDEITSGDPRWWNTPEVGKMLDEMNYTLSNSKYIQLSTHMSLSDIWWQTTILLRGLMDNRYETAYTMLNINHNINQSSTISLFEAILVLIVLMHWHLVDYKGASLRGSMYVPNGTYDGKAACLDLLFNGMHDDGSPEELKLGLPFKVASFNFNVKTEDPEFYNSISKMTFIEPDVLLPMLDNIFVRENNNLVSVLSTEVQSVYKYLESKLRTTRTIHDFREVTDVFSHLFLVDPVRDWADNSYEATSNIIIEEFGITEQDWNVFINVYSPDSTPRYHVSYKSKTYDINVYDVLTTNVNYLKINGDYPFTDDGFVSAFSLVVESTKLEEVEQSPAVSSTIKSSYKAMINDKVTMDVSSTEAGPKTFEALLFRTDISLYKYVMSIKNNGEQCLLLMRSIIKALENYANINLSGLEFKAIGEEEYFNILKEVIRYFKSYMVEFTKEEFSYIFDGLFDNGGNSNMLRLHDEMVDSSLEAAPKESLTLFDVSTANVDLKFKDDNRCHLYDDALFRIVTAYQNLLNTNYEIWYDDGKRITQRPSFEIDPTTEVMANIVSDDVSYAYKIIVNISNIIPDNYYGNAR